MNFAESQALFPTGVSITTHLQRNFWKLFGHVLKASVVLGILLKRIIGILLIPFVFVGQLVFSVLLVNMYKLYFMIKSRLSTVWRPAKNRILYPLATRYVLHGILVVTTVFVTTNSIGAREIRQDDSWKPSILSSLLKNESLDDEIVEYAKTTIPDTEYYGGIGGISPLDVSQAPLEADIAVATQQSSVLLKPQLTNTTVGERPRVSVEYHIVEGGETISTIAARYNISVNTILWENQLGPKDFIKPGQKLTILPVTGVSHRIAKNETIAAIAKKYQATEQEIIEYNKLVDASAISEGLVLLVPGGKEPPPPPPPAPAPTTRLARGSGLEDSGAAPANAKVSGGGLIWPTNMRKINQYWGLRHTGVDIDGEYSSPIYAAESGRVVQVGWGGGYGLHVTLDHGNGMRTLYAHASKMFVKMGQTVSKGQTLAMQGCTGWCTGVHLHFEIYINGRRVNPLSYL